MEEEMIGLYARTNTGKIFRFAWVENEKYILIITKSEYGYLNYEKYWLEKDEEIIKHSKNIIDLIEVGDYVNGYICRYITDIDTGKEILCNYDLNEMRWIPLESIDIWESIVTHQQFASMEYKV